MTNQTRSLLRAIPSLTGAAPPLDLDGLPSDPVALFLDWLTEARRDVAEPHAMTLSTVDPHGVPDARVVVLKDVDADEFRTGLTSGGRSEDETGSAGMSDLIPLRNACVSREDVLQGGLADNRIFRVECGVNRPGFEAAAV